MLESQYDPQKPLYLRLRVPLGLNVITDFYAQMMKATSRFSRILTKLL